MQKVTETIRGQQYMIIKLDPIRGGRMATRVAQHLAGALEDVNVVKELLSTATHVREEGQEAAGEELKSKLSKIMDAPQLISALAGGIAKVNGEALYDCALECVRGNLFADAKIHDDQAFNEWFGNHPDHMLAVLAWALKVNCTGFFALGGRV